MLGNILLVSLYFLYFFFFLIFKCLFLRGRDRARAGEGQKKGETEILKQAPGSEVSAQSPTWGLNPPTARS